MNKSDKKLINQIKETLKDEFNPSRLFIFGSRANGTATKDSDFDFVMVVPGSGKTSVKKMSKARDLVWDKHRVPADIFIYTEKEFTDWKDELNSIPETALNTGIEIDL